MALTEFLTNIANAIRGKKGTTALINAQDFATEITNLPSGGGENKLPQVVDRTVREISASDLAGATKIGQYAFYYCESLTSVVIPEGVTSIGKNAFDGCKSLASIEIPDSVTSIGSSAFKNCVPLTSIEIPNGVTSIGSSAFESCAYITSVVIPNGVTRIDTNTFYTCYRLVEIVFPANLTYIGYGAFSNATKLKLFDFRNATQIPTLSSTSAFNNTPSSRQIVVPDTLYDDWIVASNWSTYASNIVKASEYTVQ